MKINCSCCGKPVTLPESKDNTKPTAYFCDYCQCAYPIDSSMLSYNMDVAPGYTGNPFELDVKPIGDRRR